MVHYEFFKYIKVLLKINFNCYKTIIYIDKKINLLFIIILIIYVINRIIVNFYDDYIHKLMIKKISNYKLFH